MLESPMDYKWNESMIYDLSISEVKEMQNEIHSMILEKESDLDDLENSLRTWKHKAEQKDFYIQATKELGRQNLTLMTYLNKVDKDRRYSPFFSPQGYWNSAKDGIVKITTLTTGSKDRSGNTHLQNCINWTKSLINEVSSDKNNHTEAESETALFKAVQFDILPILEEKLKELEALQLNYLL
ncbi:hypothetical protein PaeCFBP13512_19750 [Paenibacillus sp. CFBP13512]|uniref:hypothetical protein n=1 Tax=Paenibacillus sp. CFBP13512 TaxID=2184007 RepID=UPI0010C0931C|nr:hypothetical protein [Paenibacillus sp. CFBP13512]TKJ86070.1 hypothetical protein PaeCFBP13512_19750 [Paenibacillus sp. CFBP13512]